MTDRAPVRKVAAGGISGAVTALLISGLDLVGVDVTQGLASAITTAAGFAVAYLTPSTPAEYVDIDMPTGILRADRRLSDKEVADLIARWQAAQNGPTEADPSRHAPRPD